jgi:L-serine dehydratase
MAISTFELFKIGIGPSSSHTVGPMRAAKMFVDSQRESGQIQQVERVEVHLFGSLGATGKGHGTDKAVIGGLQGWEPETADPQALIQLQTTTGQTKRLLFGGERELNFDPQTQIKFSGKVIGAHVNAMEIHSFALDGTPLLSKRYYSVGGGFVVNENAKGEDRIVEDQTRVPYPFSSGQQLLQLCDDHGLSVSTVMLKNEQAWRTESEIRAKLLEIWQVMKECVKRGCKEEGILPGGLKVRRRAAPLYRQLQSESASEIPLSSMDWVDLWALAVNEENAAGGRVVTAPTNGAAGIIPAVLHYYHRFCPGADDEGTVRFLLTAAAIGTLFKINASISGAEVGCQGEVGSACSMAAAGLAEVLGGTPAQVENAAEIGMEHNLGLTCDPIGGLVQIPCIERNAMGAVKAINAARLAMRGDGKHFVSLDKVIRTMRETGKDMKTKYKETARGGLAVNVIEC